MITELYHGAHTRFSLHVGQCFTDRLASAVVYQGSCGYLAEVAINLDGLTVVSVESYDRDTNTAVGDSAADVATADIVEYDDEDERGCRHRTWRIMTERALAAVTVVCVTSENDDE